jgi:hypothetical protein
LRRNSCCGHRLTSCCLACAAFATCSVSHHHTAADSVHEGLCCRAGPLLGDSLLCSFNCYVFTRFATGACKPYMCDVCGLTQQAAVLCCLTRLTSMLSMSKLLCTEDAVHSRRGMAATACASVAAGAVAAALPQPWLRSAGLSEAHSWLTPRDQTGIQQLSVWPGRATRQPSAMNSASEAEQATAAADVKRCPECCKPGVAQQLVKAIKIFPCRGRSIPQS